MGGGLDSEVWVFVRGCPMLLADRPIHRRGGLGGMGGGSDLRGWIFS
jgi:hypothetical protein